MLDGHKANHVVECGAESQKEGSLSQGAKRQITLESLVSKEDGFSSYIPVYDLPSYKVDHTQVVLDLQ